MADKIIFLKCDGENFTDSLLLILYPLDIPRLGEKADA